MTNNEGKVVLQHVPSSSFKVAPADGASITILKDHIGSTVQITFTRLDATPRSESFLGKKRTGLSVEQTGPQEFQTELRKVQEFAVVMRPDHAFNVGMVILKNLADLDKSQRERYRLPEIKIEEMIASWKKSDENRSI